MGYYRVYLIDIPDRIIEFREVMCDNDDDALMSALPWSPAWPVVEIWDGVRRVAKLNTTSAAGLKRLKAARGAQLTVHRD